MNPLLVFILSAAFAAAAYGGMPSGTYSDAEIDAACAEAKKEGKAISLIIVNRTTDVVENAIRRLDDHSVVVYLDFTSQDRFAEIGPVGFTGLKEEKMGQTIPRAVTLSPDLTELWGQLSNPQVKDNSAHRELKARIQAIQAGEAKPILTWEDNLSWQMKNSTGMRLVKTGKVAGISKDGKDALIGKGRPVGGALPGNLRFAKNVEARKAGAAKAEAVVAAAEGLTIEDWSNPLGVKLRGKFLSLDGEKLTLEKEGGGEITLTLDKLSKASQARAKEIAEDVGGG